jgi:hypothetical protein
MKNHLTEIQDYFDTLCSKHTDLLHGVGGLKSFYRLTQDESSVLNATGVIPHTNSVHIVSYGGRYTGSPELLSKPVTLTLNILTKAADVSEAEKEAAYFLAESIMDDIISAIAYDTEIIGDCFPLYGVDFSSITFDRTGPHGQYGHGYRLNLPIRKNGPTYNAQKWIN